MEKTTDVDGKVTINHHPSRKRAGSKNDYKALLDSTEENQLYEFVKKTPFGEVPVPYIINFKDCVLSDRNLLRESGVWLARLHARNCAVMLLDKSKYGCLGH